MDDDPNSTDFGGSIQRYLTKLAPGQTRLYCKVVPEQFRAVDKKGNYQVFYANQPLGKNAISELFKEGAALMGLPSPKRFSPHSLRAYMVTMLANGEGKYSDILLLFFLLLFSTDFCCIFLGVSDQERMDSCRHDSVAANSIYQERDSTSETNKFAALGIKPLTVTPDPVTPSNKKLHYYEISLTPPTTKNYSSPSADMPSSQPTNFSVIAPKSSSYSPPTDYLPKSNSYSPLTDYLPKSNSYSPPTDYSLTQEALSVVERDIVHVRNSFPPNMSSRHQAVLKMGEEVQELKREVVFLRDSLRNSLSHQELLKRRIFHFEQREEAELIRQSRELEEEKEAFYMNNFSNPYKNRTYSSNSNFSANFNHK